MWIAASCWRFSAQILWEWNQAFPQRHYPEHTDFPGNKTFLYPLSGIDLVKASLLSAKYVGSNSGSFLVVLSAKVKVQLFVSLGRQRQVEYSLFGKIQRVRMFFFSATEPRARGTQSLGNFPPQAC